MRDTGYGRFPHFFASDTRFDSHLCNTLDWDWDGVARVALSSETAGYSIPVDPVGK